LDESPVSEFKSHTRAQESANDPMVGARVLTDDRALYTNGRDNEGRRGRKIVYGKTGENPKIIAFTSVTALPARRRGTSLYGRGVSRPVKIIKAKLMLVCEHAGVQDGAYAGQMYLGTNLVFPRVH